MDFYSRQFRGTRMGQVAYYTPWPSGGAWASNAPAPLPDEAPGTPPSPALEDLEPAETLSPGMNPTDAAFLIGTGITTGILLLTM
jgi:hypothetical protein